MEKEKTGIVSIALKLFVICFVSTLILAFVNNITKGIIEKNDKILFEKSCEEVLPGTASINMVDISEYLPEAEAALCYDEGGNIIGIAVKRSVKGYNSGLVVMTGVSYDGKTVKGIRILDHEETPGLGALATNKKFTSQFENKEFPLATVKDGGDIVAISGATKTTKGIIGPGVNEAAKAAKEYFEKESATDEIN